MGDELIPNFATKFHRSFIISHVKLQNCHGNSSCISISAKMASRFLKTVTLEEVTELKEAAENVNARKSTMKWVKGF